MLTYLKVFIVGGALCALGEVLILKTKLTPARILVLYITAGGIAAAVFFGFLAAVLFRPRPKDF